MSCSAVSFHVSVELVQSGPNNTLSEQEEIINYHQKRIFDSSLKDYIIILHRTIYSIAYAAIS